MIIPAGAKVSAELLSDALPLVVMAVVDSSATNDVASDSVTGMVLALAADSSYLIDGYVGYSAGAAGDMRVSWSAPDGWTGSWSWLGLDPNSVGSVGNMLAISIGVIEGVSILMGGSDSFDGALAARLCMFVETDANAGDLQMRFAQVTASGTPTIIRQGSWLRAQKVT